MILETIGGSENNLKTKKIPFTSFLYNGVVHWIYLSPRFPIYFPILYWLLCVVLPFEWIFQWLPVMRFYFCVFIILLACSRRTCTAVGCCFPSFQRNGNGACVVLFWTDGEFSSFCQLFAPDSFSTSKHTELTYLDLFSLFEKHVLKSRKYEKIFLKPRKFNLLRKIFLSLL